MQTTQIAVEGLGLDEATWFHSIKNSGKEEARGITLKVGTIEWDTKKTGLLQKFQWVRLGPDLQSSGTLPFHTKDFLGFFVTCLTYSGQPAREKIPSFYRLLDWERTTTNVLVQPTPATPAEDKALSSGFSCAKL